MNRKETLILLAGVLLGGTILGANWAISSPPPAAPKNGEVLTEGFLQGLVDSILATQALLESPSLGFAHFGRVRTGDDAGVTVDIGVGADHTEKLSFNDNVLGKAFDESAIRLAFTGSLQAQRTAGLPCYCTLMVKASSQGVAPCVARRDLLLNPDTGTLGGTPAPEFMDIAAPISVFENCLERPSGDYTLEVSLTARTPSKFNGKALTAGTCRCSIQAGLDGTNVGLSTNTWALEALEVP
jgi:hypothetical protein